MDLIPNAQVKARGWYVFRSSSRDRLIPLTSLRSVAQRIRLNDVIPAAGVGVGEAVLSEADVKARLDAEQQVTVRLRERVDRASSRTGARQFVWATLGGPGHPGLVIGENRITLFSAPSDGYIVAAAGSVNSNFTRYAIRTTSGASLFIGTGGTSNVGLTPRLEPDYIDDTQPLVLNGIETVRVAVVAGEEVFLVGDSIAVVGPGVYLGHVQFVFEYAVGGIRESERFGADFGEIRVAVRQQAEQSTRLASDQLRLEIERERTRRAQIEAQARASELTRIPAAAPKVASRAPVQPPPLFASEAPTADGGGKGKTFVSAWMPSNGYVGYYIPDPPAGGKVNVFDGRYTIWDVGGRNVGSGPVEWVRQDQQLQEGTRISRNLGVRPGSTLPTTSYIPGVGFL